MVEASDGIRIHYLYDAPYGKETGGGNQSHKGAIASAVSTAGIIYKDEMYDVRKGRNWTLDAPNFGIPFGAKHISVHIELPADGDVARWNKTRTGGELAEPCGPYKEPGNVMTAIGDVTAGLELIERDLGLLKGELESRRRKYDGWARHWAVTVETTAKIIQQAKSIPSDAPAETQNNAQHIIEEAQKRLDEAKKRQAGLPADQSARNRTETEATQLQNLVLNFMSQLKAIGGG